MAQSNTRTLLVDTDMRRPRVHKVFDMKNVVGLTSLLLGESTYQQAIKETQVPNLDVLVCGPIPPNPTELLHTKRFIEIVEDLDDLYDVVIYDSPPVVAVADSMVLSNLVDGVIFVIRSGVTSIELAKRAKERLLAVNGTILGTVVNAIDLQDRRSGYYYSYYRRYTQYYQEDPEEVEVEATDVS
jgi:capsular exopolysaccharide synthesis family protein